MTKHIIDRFCDYARIDTQSDPESTTFPSTEKQKDLSRLLVQELLELGLEDAHLDEHGYVYATLKSNVNRDSSCDMFLCACGHLT